MHHLLPNNLVKALDDISAARLSSYRMFFQPGSDEALYGLYCWNETVSSRIMRLIGIVEVILRNRFHQILSRHIWNPAVSLGTSDSNDWYKFVLPHGSFAADKVRKETHRKLGNGQWVEIQPKVSPNKVVASMTYGFWPRLLDITQSNNGTALPWDTLIPQVVPGHHQRSPTYWSNQHHQDKLFARMDFVGDIRNRVAHFEPIWKFKELKSEWRQRHNYPIQVIKPAPSSIEETINRLKMSYNRATQLLHWLSKERAMEYRLSENHHTLEWLITENAVERYKNLASEDVARLSSLTKSWGLKIKMRKTQSITVVDKAKIIGRFYPAIVKP